MSWLTDFFADKTITAPGAGDNTDRVITSKWFKTEQATETVQGTAKAATQTQANAGTDDATFITPKKLRAGFAASFTNNGYIAFPTWLGGLIIQWGLSESVPAGTVVGTTFPLAFPTGVLAMVTTYTNSGAIATSGVPSNLYNVSKTNFVIYNGGAGPSQYSYIAIGR